MVNGFICNDDGIALPIATGSASTDSNAPTEPWGDDATVNSGLSIFQSDRADFSGSD
jgi:hypothetical protein